MLKTTGISCQLNKSSAAVDHHVTLKLTVLQVRALSTLKGQFTKFTSSFADVFLNIWPENLKHTILKRFVISSEATSFSFECPLWRHSAVILFFWQFQATSNSFTVQMTQLYPAYPPTPPPHFFSTVSHTKLPHVSPGATISWCQWQQKHLLFSRAGD